MFFFKNFNEKKSLISSYYGGYYCGWLWCQRSLFRSGGTLWLCYQNLWKIYSRIDLFQSRRSSKSSRGENGTFTGRNCRGECGEVLWTGRIFQSTCRNGIAGAIRIYLYWNTRSWVWFGDNHLKPREKLSKFYWL